MLRQQLADQALITEREVPGEGDEGGIFSLPQSSPT